MKTIIDVDGNEIDFDVAVTYMDDGLREEIHREFSPCTAQEFYDAYCKLHEHEFGEEFIIN